MLTIWAARLILPALPYLLSFAAGAMIYVVVEELIPEASAGELSNLGTLFFAAGFTVMLFYYFETEQVRRLLCVMAERFPGGMIAFDAVNALGLKGVDAEVKPAGESADSHFSLENPKEELESWSPNIVNVVEKDYADGYLKGGYRKTFVTRLFNWTMRTFHMSFMLHVEFAK